MRSGMVWWRSDGPFRGILSPEPAFPESTIRRRRLINARHWPTIVQWGPDGRRSGRGCDEKLATRAARKTAGDGGHAAGPRALPAWFAGRPDVPGLHRNQPARWPVGAVLLQT